MRIVITAILLVAGLIGLIFVAAFAGPGLGPFASRALATVTRLASLIAVGCFLLSQVTDNYSQVDKIWSLAPLAYVWIVACFGDFSPRLMTMSLLVTLWGIRLTFNFWLKGGYHWKFWQGCEDYRWQVLRQKPELKPQWKWTLFNLLFISGYQNALILMMTLPIVVALQFNDREFHWVDTVATTTMLFLIAFESVADWQQWRYQLRKQRRLATSESTTGDIDPGFLNRGLWAWSRHPNYFAEQGIWMAFYLFSVAASGQWINWSIAGCVLLVLLFRGSSNFSEEISLSKYPDYEMYQQRVPRFLPIGNKYF